MEEPAVLYVYRRFPGGGGAGKRSGGDCRNPGGVVVLSVFVFRSAADVCGSGGGICIWKKIKRVSGKGRLEKDEKGLDIDAFLRN